MSRHLASIAACLTIAALTGCVSPTIKVTRIHPGPDATERKVVKVYNEGEPSPTNYEVLGVVSGFCGKGNHADDKATLQKLQVEAAAMGADALVGYYASILTKAGANHPHLTMSSAMAVRLLPEGQTATNRNGACIVAVPHAKLDENIATGNGAAKLDESARTFARYYLARKGYYTILVVESSPGLFAANLKAVDDSGLADIAGAPAGSVLGIRFVEKKNLPLIVFSADSLTLETVLYSKSLKNVTWTNAGTGVAATGWLINMTLPNTKRVLAIWEALDKSFETLPDISTKTTEK